MRDAADEREKVICQSSRRELVKDGERSLFPGAVQCVAENGGKRIMKMKVQNFYEPMVMKLEEHDVPQIADNEMLIKVKAVGICGSDISYYYGHT